MFKKLSRIHALILIIIFAVAGTVYLLASHADTCTTSIPGTTCTVTGSGQCVATEGASCTVISGCSTLGLVSNGTDNLIVSDTTGKKLSGVSLGVSGTLCGNTKSCYGVSSSGTTDANGQLPVSCSISALALDPNSSYFNLTSISLPGYTVSSASPYKIGSQVPISISQVGTINIIMLANPSAPASGGGGTTSGGAPANSSHSTSTKGSGSSSGSSSSGSTAASSSPSSQTNPSSTTATPSNTDNNNSLVASPGLVNVPQGSSATVESSDGIVTVTFPSGTFSTDAECTIDSTSATGLPGGSTGAIGPYAIDCNDSNGNPLTTFNQPASVKVKLPSSKGYIAYVGDTNWSKASSSTKDKTLNFSLAKATSFAVKPKPSTNYLTIALEVGAAIVVMLIIFVVIRIILRRQYIDSQYV